MVRPTTTDLIEADLAGPLLGPQHIPELAESIAKHLANLNRLDSYKPIEVVTGAHIGIATRLGGYSWRETGLATAVRLIFHHGRSTAAPRMLMTTIPASDSDIVFFAKPIRCPNGVFVELVAGGGTVDAGVLYID